MCYERLLRVFCIAFCAGALALPARAEIAGQVLIAVGDVSATRAGKTIRFSPNAEIESGDRIHTGAASNLQILFTDSGLVSIHSGSDFVVDKYSYREQRSDPGTAFFRLLKGGGRFVTGLIGQRNRENYMVRVPTAVIGVRGTHFSLHLCRRECGNSDGKPAAEGLYGEVIEGRIAVTPAENKALAREFGAGESFHLADAKSAPAPLTAPPPFLKDKLDKQARSAGKTGAAPGDRAQPGAGPNQRDPGPPFVPPSRR